ncbi:AAA family ATPase [Gordonia sp. SID5947]|uniref:helix-turn-helix transcriptional regulator n=1 Tax=Gordonia sp. SID5947 TaxID=2690315 RepID=UPI00136E3CD3|nr:LuxR family transcriptional regulator [Gordonia sp. SID5947]MYR08060.1 AAA family ATPase [Gordonia sp. SID5947]
MVDHAAHLHGRDEIMSAIGAFVTARTGGSALIVGADGSGKSSLVRVAESLADNAGIAVVRVSADSRTGPSPVLRCIVDATDGAFDELDPPRRRVLQIALGDTEGVRPSPLVLSAALLDLIRRRTRRGPLLITVDDAHLIDRDGAEILASVTRRLRAEPVALLAAAPAGEGVFAERFVDHTWRLPPLSAPAAHQLLRDRLPMLSGAARSHVVETTPGNPRTLIEQGTAELSRQDAAVAHTRTQPNGLRDTATTTDHHGVARLLDGVAVRAMRRGDARAASFVLERAVDMSADPSSRARRLAAAACLTADVTGDLPALGRLLDQALRADPGAAHSLEAVIAASYVALRGSDGIADVHRRLVQAIGDRRDEIGHWVFEEALWALYLLCWFGNQREHWHDFRAVVEADIARAPSWAVLAARLESRSTFDDADLDAQADRLIENLAFTTDPSAVVRIAFVTRGRDRRFWWRSALQRLWADEDSPFASVIYAGAMLAADGLSSGNWKAVDQITHRALKLCATQDYRMYAESWLRHSQALLAAYRGEQQVAQSTVIGLQEWADDRGAAALYWRALHCRAVIALGAGQARRAHRLLRMIPGTDGFGAVIAFDDRTALDFAEAAVLAGTPDDIESIRTIVAVHPVDDRPAADRRTLLYAGALAIISDDDRYYERAVSIPEADRWPFDLARIQLSRGRFLRAQGATAQARTALRAAAVTFRYLGAEPWLAQTHAELGRLGTFDEGHRLVHNDSQVSPIGRRVAELAATGLSNRQIGAVLHMSPSTVGSHLSRVYAAIGVHSRAGLRDSLRSDSIVALPGARHA